MIKIESLKDKVTSMSPDSFSMLAYRIYMITDFICEDYPKHKEWYFSKHLPRTVTEETGEILYAYEEQEPDKILAMACLKKDDEEQKICTLYVDPKVRGQHLGTRMIESSMTWLGTTRPLITIADYKLPMFAPIIEKYGWTLDEEVSGLYNDKAKELCYNGTLTLKRKENAN